NSWVDVVEEAFSAPSRSYSTGLVSNSSHPVAIAFSRSPASTWECPGFASCLSDAARLPSRQQRATATVTLSRKLYPQKHGQEDQDRVQRDPHDVGSPPPPILYGLLAHGEFSLA